jgi:HSP20 family protein
MRVVIDRWIHPAAAHEKEVSEVNTLRMWSPGDLSHVTLTMDRLFDEFFGSGGTVAPGGGKRELPTYTLPVDVVETDAAYILTAPVPGFTPEQVDVTFDQGVLSISAKAEPLQVQGAWIRQERPYGSWLRRLQLPDQVQGDAIEAGCENGLLTVTVPKLPAPAPVRIPIGGKQKAGDQAAGKQKALSS